MLEKIWEGEVNYIFKNKMASSPFKITKEQIFQVKELAIQIPWGNIFKRTTSTEILKWEKYMYKLYVPFSQEQILTMNYLIDTL